MYVKYHLKNHPNMQAKSEWKAITKVNFLVDEVVGVNQRWFVTRVNKKLDKKYLMIPVCLRF